jgi:hypothetical protein
MRMPAHHAVVGNFSCDDASMGERLPVPPLRKRALREAARATPLRITLHQIAACQL